MLKARYSEFNLATPKELFSYCEAIISLCTNVQNLAKKLSYLYHSVLPIQEIIMLQ